VHICGQQNANLEQQVDACFKRAEKTSSHTDIMQIMICGKVRGSSEAEAFMQKLLLLLLPLL